MIILRSKLQITDNSGGKIAKCIKVLGFSNKKVATIGNIIFITIQNFLHRKKVQKRIVYIGLIITIKYWLARLDGTNIKVFSNRILVFNKLFKFLGSRIFGIFLKEVKLKNLKEKTKRTNFNKIISYNSFII